MRKGTSFGAQAIGERQRMGAMEWDVVGIGNAIVDIVARADDTFLIRHDIPKGGMTLVDEARADALYEAMGPAIEISGGSAANTMVGAAQLGAATGYIGKVRDDAMGAVFRHDITAAGVRFETPFSDDGAATARCLVFVTPDAERSMNTCLGACLELGTEDIDPAVIAAARITYMEGYLWDPPGAKEAFRKALGIAHANDRLVSLSLSDPFCVERHRAEFLDLVENHVDVLFANEQEIVSLYQVEDFDAALQRVRGHCAVAALTRGARGSVVASPDEVHIVDAAPVESVVDTTGAGDLYAAGFLYGLSRDFDLAHCGRLAALTAAEIIDHFGARPASDIAGFVEASRHPGESSRAGPRAG